MKKRYDNDLNDHADEIISNLRTKNALLWIVLVLIVGGWLTAWIVNPKQEESTELPQEEFLTEEEEISEELTRSDSIVCMAIAFAIQETKCNDLVSPCGNYVGYLQMSEILVREVNNILGKQVYTYDDRRDWASCIAMLSVIMESKNPTLDIEKAIDIWNLYCPNAYRNAVRNYYRFLLNTFRNME